MQKKLLIVVVAVLILLGGVIFVWQKKQNEKQDVLQKSEGVQEMQSKRLDDLLAQAEEIQLPKVDTTGWRTYGDEKLGVEFMYPKGWVVQDFALWDKSRQVICVNTVDGRYAGFESGGECSVQIELSNSAVSVIDNIPDQWIQTGSLLSLSKIQNALFESFIIVSTKGQNIAFIATNKGIISINISWMRDQKDIRDTFYGILQTLKPIQK